PANSGSFKVRLARPFGKRTALAIHAGFGGSKRQSGTLQDENVTSGDLALPFEVLLAMDPAKKVALSASIAPRVVSEWYKDRLDPASNLNATFAGGTAGVHLRAWFLDFYTEGTVARLPGNTYKGSFYPARTIAAASLVLSFRIGHAYDWMGK